MIRFVCLAVALAVLLCGSVRAQPKVTDKQVNLWVEKVRQLKPDQQDTAFRAKMGEMNSKLDTNAIKIVSDKDGVVREITIPGGYAEDIRPVALFRDIEKITCVGTAGQVSQVTELSGFQKLTKLKELNIEFSKVADLSPLAELPIEKLWLSQTNVKDIRALKKMPLTVVVLPEQITAKQLEVLTGKPLTNFVTRGPGPDSAKEVKTIFVNSKLETYSVARSNLESLEFFADMPLKSLALGASPNLKELAPLKDCAALKALSFAHAPKVKDLTPIAKKSLTYLSLSHCSGIRDLSPLKQSPDLNSLFLTAIGPTPRTPDQAIDISPVAGLKNLDALWIVEMQIPSLKPVANLPHVHVLRVHALTVADKDFTPITNLPGLGILYVDVNPVTMPLINKIPTLKELNGKNLPPPK